MVKSYKAVSLFSGAGGMDVGFAKAGFEIFWANDFNKDACKTYEMNFGPHIVCDDINNNLDKLSSFSNIDVVFGGPPCQGFSVAGKMDPNDERSKLVWSFLTAIEIIRPRIFVMENVKSLATLSQFEKIRENLITKAITLGYSVDLVVLNAKDYGVPQSRERMFLVGIYKFQEGIDFYKTVQKYKDSCKAVRDVILPLGRAGTANNKRICNAKITIAAKPVLRRSPYAGMLFNGQGRPTNPDLPACTLHASMGGNRTPIIDENHLFDNAPSWVEQYHAHLMNGGKPYPMNAAPDFLRRLTIDEALLLQTFPVDYQFYGSQSSIYRQIGNAVPCKLAEVVAKSVIDLLENRIDIDKTSSSQLTLCI